MYLHLKTLFILNNKGRNASKRYKGFIAARNPAKKNNICKKKPDTHFWFSWVKMRREFDECHKNEVITGSCDDMNKLNVGGGMMVSCYHINWIFLFDDSSDYEDHNFNLPGYKVCISGYMCLEFNDDEPIAMQATSDDSFTEVELNINEDPFQTFSQKKDEEDTKALMKEIIAAVEKGSLTVGHNKFLKDSNVHLHIVH